MFQTNSWCHTEIIQIDWENTESHQWSIILDSLLTNIFIQIKFKMCVNGKMRQIGHVISDYTPFVPLQLHRQASVK